MLSYSTVSYHHPAPKVMPPTALVLALCLQRRPACPLGSRVGNRSITAPHQKVCYLHVLLASYRLNLHLDALSGAGGQVLLYSVVQSLHTDNVTSCTSLNVLLGAMYGGGAQALSDYVPPQISHPVSHPQVIAPTRSYNAYKRAYPDHDFAIKS